MFSDPRTTSAACAGEMLTPTSASLDCIHIYSRELRKVVRMRGRGQLGTAESVVLRLRKSEVSRILPY